MNMAAKRLFLICTIALSLSAKIPAQPANIIFDMNGVLTQPSIFHTLWHIGPSRFLGLFNPLNVESTLFNFLHRIKPLEPSTPRAMHKNKYRLPQIMCDWLMGNLHSQALLTIVNSGINDIARMIDSKRKVELIRSITTFMFDPIKLAQTTMRIDAGYKLLKKCRREVDAQGRPLHRIFIITNWDMESFPLLYDNKRVGKMLSMVDGIVVSGDVHMIKPDPAIFELAFEQFEIDPDHEFTVYIDDEACNVKGAQSLNKRKLKCIQCTGDYKAIRKELKRYRVLKSKH